jgi:hypothetical protein
VPADLVPQYVHLLGDGDGPETVMVDSVAPAGEPTDVTLPPSLPAPDGPITAAPLGHVIGARSGDKGGDANLGVFARTEAGWAWLDNELTIDRLHELLPETASLDTERFRFPAIRSLNFVIHGLLDEGVAASTRQDAQAKALGEWLRARILPIPDVVLAAEASRS